MMIISIDRIFEFEFSNVLPEDDKWKTDLINEIYDANKTCVYNLTEEESFIIKKRFGVYDDGKIPTYEVIINEFNKRFNQNWNTNYFSSYVKKRIIDKLIGYITTEELGNETFIRDLPISLRAKRTLIRDCGFKTLDDVMKIDKHKLRIILKNKKETYDEIINYIFSLNPLESEKNKDYKTNACLTPISNLSLNEKIINALYRQDICTLGDLIQHSIDEIKIMPGIGAWSLNKIVECVNCLGLSFCNNNTKERSKTKECNDYIADRINKMKIEQLTKLRNALLAAITTEYANRNDLNNKRLRKNNM